MCNDWNPKALEVVILNMMKLNLGEGFRRIFDYF